MVPESRTYGRLVTLLAHSLLGLIISWVLSIRRVENESTLLLHATISEFLKRGQMVLELLPPFSYLLARLPTTQLTLVAFWLRLSLSFTGTLFVAPPSRTSGFTGAILAAPAALYSLYPISQWTVNALTISRDIGDACLTLCFSFILFTTNSVTDLLHWESHFGLLELLPVVALALGSNMLDTGIYHVMLLVYRLRPTFDDLADTNRTVVGEWYYFMISLLCS